MFFANKFKKLILPVLICVVAALLSSCSSAAKDFNSFAMGSVLSVGIYDAKEPEKIFDGINSAVSKTDRLISAVIDGSDIARLNKEGTVSADADVVRLLCEVKRICGLSGGAVDLTMGAVTELWGFTGGEPRVPDKSDIAEAVKTVGWLKVNVDEASSVVSIGEGQKIDLGAFGKGTGLDAAHDVLKNYEASAVVTLGGTVMFYKDAPGGKSRTLGIRDPLGNENDFFATLSLMPSDYGDAVFISTSGGYEKNFVSDGVTYHHILDTKTGYPCESELLQVTVICRGGTLADGLSTACFIKGYNESTLNMLAGENAGAVFVFKDKSVAVTPELAGKINIVNGEYRLKGF